jgi:hypothetical protein
MLRGLSAKGPPEDALVEKIVQQVQYVNEIDYVNHSYSLTKSEITDAKFDTGYYLRTILILIVLGMCLVDYRATRLIQNSEIRLLTLVELSLSCRCANTQLRNVSKLWW